MDRAVAGSSQTQLTAVPEKERFILLYFIPPWS